MKAKVIFFDKCSGEGLIKLFDLDGKSWGTYGIYACNIPGKRTWYPQTACMYYEEGTEIEVDVVEGGFKCLTPGIFDEAKWNSLDHARLAFRCDENGKAITGLFAPSRKD